MKTMSDNKLNVISSSLAHNIDLDLKKQSLYFGDVRITEEDIKQLLLMKKKGIVFTADGSDTLKDINDQHTINDENENGKKKRKEEDGKNIILHDKKECLNIKRLRIVPTNDINTSNSGSVIRCDDNSNNINYSTNKKDKDELDDNNLKMISAINCTIYLTKNRINKDIDIPSNVFINALYMDYYHIVMAYTFFKHKKHTDNSVFEIYFRTCPFHGKFAIFAGIYEIIKYINSFCFTTSQLNFLKKKMSHYPDIDLFIDYLKTVSGKDISIYSMDEGDIVFPNEPLVIIEGPLLICQMLEAALLNLVNFPTLVATNSMLYKIGVNQKMIAEFGCRRAQGPDGSMSGSRYAHFGCDFTSNVYASFLYDLPLIGTMSHAFITSFKYEKELLNRYINKHDFLNIIYEKKKIIYNLYKCDMVNESELIAFIAFAQINPANFFCVIDTYDTLQSGIYNFLIVALALHEIKYKPVGIRIDSGDLAYLTKECKKVFIDISKQLNVPFNELKICVSNDINHEIVKKLENEKQIDLYAIGTNLITCQPETSLKIVYKLAQINNYPCYKKTNENHKATYPYKKNVYRLYNKENNLAVCDYIQHYEETQPISNQCIDYVHFENQKAQHVTLTPAHVEKKVKNMWDHGKSLIKFKTSKEVKQYTLNELKKFKKDHFDKYEPTPYNVCYSKKYFDLFSTIVLKKSV
ncbi:nicotinate phosphoribosyltransferase, putative [Hepatocystis sp. ex Piliocolobus tephrosceles]|nr:nicotinate phosphoribosyltransferase, putative [Hepatocystis sp. ex Piliocolobus tephrosceles]